MHRLGSAEGLQSELYRAPPHPELASSSIESHTAGPTPHGGAADMAGYAVGEVEVLAMSATHITIDANALNLFEDHVECAHDKASNLSACGQ